MTNFSSLGDLIDIILLIKEREYRQKNRFNGEKIMSVFWTFRFEMDIQVELFSRKTHVIRFQEMSLGYQYKSKVIDM